MNSALLAFLVVLLSVTISFAAQVTLEWDANTELDLAGYNMYYGTSSGNYDTSIDVDNYTSITISGLDVGETYYFAVTAYNLDGIESGFSNEVVHTISDRNGNLLLSDIEVAYSAQVSLEWDANTELDLAGYNMYYGTSSGNYDTSIDVGNYTSITISGLDVGETYYFAVAAYNLDGIESGFSNEVVHTISDRNGNLLLSGLGTYPSSGGWVETFTTDFNHDTWQNIRWTDYNTSNGETRIATGDIDGDGKDEIIVSLGPVSGNPSVPGGWFKIFDDALAGYAHLTRSRIGASAYNTANGESWPACGDVDGDGKDEIIMGLGSYTASGGWLEVFDFEGGTSTHKAWLQVKWPAYNSSNGETRPASGDIDGDGRDEIVVGLAQGGGGYLEVFDDALAGYAHLTRSRIGASAYNTANGESWPACGDVDGDGKDEIIMGLGSYTASGGWLEVFDFEGGTSTHKAWLQVKWPAYNSSNGETRPASGDIDGDGKDEIVVGLGQGGLGYLEIFDDASAGYTHLAWPRVDWSAYCSGNGATWPAVIKR